MFKKYELQLTDGRIYENTELNVLLQIAEDKVDESMAKPGRRLGFTIVDRFCGSAIIYEPSPVEMTLEEIGFDVLVIEVIKHIARAEQIDTDVMTLGIAVEVMTYHWKNLVDELSPYTFYKSYRLLYQYYGWNDEVDEAFTCLMDQDYFSRQLLVTADESWLHEYLINYR